MPKISELPALVTPPTNTDVLALVNGGITKKISMQQLSDFVETGGDELFFAGTWNAATNTPTLTSGVGTKGSVYFVTTVGNTSLDAYVNWQVGDWAVYNGFQWQRVRTNNHPPLGNVIYVNANTGNDTAADGSINYPYALVSTAMASITTASSINPYTIIITGKVADPLQIYIKPWVSLKGETQGSYLDHSLALLLDASFGTIGGQWSFYIQDLELNILSFDTSSFSNTASGAIQLDNVYFNELHSNGSASNGFDLYMYECYQAGEGTFNNAGVFLFSNILTSPITLGNLPYVNTGLRLYSIANYFTGGAALSISAPTSAPSDPTFIIRGTLFEGNSITFDGTKCHVHLDASSYVDGITLTNSATIVLDSKGTGVDADFTPTHYTPVDGSVTGNLEGIDNKLATLGNLMYLGLWNAATNTPSINSGVGILNQFYIVSTSGTTTVDGNSTWNQNDWIYFNGTIWTRIAFSVYNQLSCAVLNSLGATTDITVGGNITNAVVHIGSSAANNQTHLDSPITTANQTFRVTVNSLNPYIAIGDDSGTTGVIYARAAGSGSYFSNAAAGDGCLRQGTTSRKLLLGLGGATSQITVNNTLINFNVGFTVPTTGGTAATLNYFEEGFSFTSNFTGPSTVSLTLKVTRLNNRVFLTFPGFSDTATANASMTASSNLPTRFIPSVQRDAVGTGINANIYTGVAVRISTAGTISITGMNTLATFGNFTTGNPYGINSFTITYEL